jgi:hypothetical protein
MPIEDDLVWYLTWRVRQEDGVPAKTRLVKLLYLVDLLNVRDRGQQATGLRWVFYHYGPYAAEIERVIERQLGNTIDVEGTRDFFGDRMFVYRVLEFPPDTLLEDRLRRYCDEVCDRWAVEDLNDLLSYVYFETPPMVDAVRGQPLDLLRVRRVEWPRWYRALRPPELDTSWTDRQEEWRRRFEEAFPRVELEPAARRDEDYVRSTEPSERVGDEEPIRGRLVIGAAADEA